MNPEEVYLLQLDVIEAGTADSTVFIKTSTQQRRDVKTMGKGLLRGGNDTRRHPHPSSQKSTSMSQVHGAGHSSLLHRKVHIAPTVRIIRKHCGFWRRSLRKRASTASARSARCTKGIQECSESKRSKTRQLSRGT